MTAYLIPIWDDKLKMVILYDIFTYEGQDYLNAKWHGSRRTIDQAQSYLKGVR